MVYLTLHSSAFPALRPSPGSRVNDFAWQPGPAEREVLACSTKKGGKIWDMERRGSGIKEFGADNEMRELAWSRDGFLLAIVGEETVVWKSDGTRLVTLQFNPQVEKDAIRYPKFNHSGRLLAFHEYKFPESLFHVFDVVTGACLQSVLKDHPDLMTPFVWKDEREFYCGGATAITHHKIGQDEPVRTLTQMNMDVLINLAFNEKSGILASCGYDGIRLWDPDAWIHTDSTVMEVIWHPRNFTVLAGSLKYGGVLIWDTLTKTSLHKLETFGLTWSNKISFSPDGNFMAVGDELVSVWRVSTGDKVAVCKAEGGKRVQISWSPNGEKLAVNVDGNLVSVFNLENIVTMNLRTLSMIRVAECLKMNTENGRDDVEKFFRKKEIPQKLIEEINMYLENTYEIYIWKSELLKLLARA